jgi:2-oxo-4-hydroxy-4-carboxy-5-ureidoimidazoline decarboxylase
MSSRRKARLWDTRLIEYRASPGLAGFNAAPAAAAERDLLSCCASVRWARQVAAARPYRDLAALLAVADAALADLSWPEVEQALAAHPRIGDRVTGEDRAAGWSRREQAGVAGADAAGRADLARANREYEQRFGHIFLIFAAGRSDTELLAAARDRLGNDVTVERGVVRTELGKIVRLRLARLVE